MDKNFATNINKLLCFSHIENKNNINHSSQKSKENEKKDDNENELLKKLKENEVAEEEQLRLKINKEIERGIEYYISMKDNMQVIKISEIVSLFPSLPKYISSQKEIHSLVFYNLLLFSQQNNIALNQYSFFERIFLVEK
jgi:hypothetical protein